VNIKNYDIIILLSQELIIDPSNKIENLKIDPLCMKLYMAEVAWQNSEQKGEMVLLGQLDIQMGKFKVRL
jgi:hypothetical protein